MIKVQDIIDYVERLKGGSIGREEGVQHGSASTAIKGVTLCWKASPGAMDAAGERGDELLIGHETFYDPVDSDTNRNLKPGWEDWLINRQRRDRLAKYRLTFVRLHSSVDRICNNRDFGEFLGLRRIGKADGWSIRWGVEPCTFGELIEHVKARTGMKTLRVTNVKGMDYRVKSVGLLPGGLGLDSNVAAQAHQVGRGCDVLIAGEADNYGFRFAAECGIPMIETSHEIAENPGLRHFSGMLAAEFPALGVTFYENKCIWEAA